MFDESTKAIIELLLTGRDNLANIEKRQSKRLAAIINYARDYSTFYKKLYASFPQEIPLLSGLPKVNKVMLMDKFDDVVCDQEIKFEDVKKFIADKDNIGKLFLDKYHISKTTGTTGSTGIFLEDKFTRKVCGALPRIRGGLLNWWGPVGLLKYLLRGQHYALLDIGNDHFGGYALVIALYREDPKMKKTLKFIEIMNEMPAQIAELKAFKPVGMGGYPSSFLRIAKEQREGKIDLRPVFIVFTGEMITKANRNFIESTFGCKAYLQYGSTENEVMAVQCKKGWLHYSADWFAIEPVDENYKVLPAGERSYSVLVTNLINKVMPLIRYDQGDSIMIKTGKCECGSNFPAMRVYGRKDDNFDFSDKRIYPIDLIEFLENKIENIYFLQFIQKETDEMEIRYQSIDGKDYSEMIEIVTKEFFDNNKVKNQPKLVASLKEPVQNKRSGKYQFLIKEYITLTKEI